MAEQLVAVVNPDGSLVGSGGGGGSVTVTNFPATQTVAGSVSVSNFPATQPVSGTVTANGGTSPTLANSWNVKLTDGTDTSSITTSGLGNALLVSTGTQVSGKTLSAVAVNTTGTTVDMGSAKANFTSVVQATGTITGTVTLELSIDGTVWVSSTVTANVTVAGNLALYSIGRPARYARVTLTAQAGTGTITADIMGG